MVAGALLNFTPCVLPAIPVKVRTILREAGNQWSHRLLAALAFMGGCLSFFVGLGIVTAMLQWSWGTLFQSSLFLSFLIVVLVGFAGLTYTDSALPVPAFAYRMRGHRYVEPALSGAFSAILAAPCAGPFLGGVLAYALTQSQGATVGIFAAIGLGLSLPYVIVLLRPALLARLPKVGAWSVRVRQALAFVLLAAAVFFAASLVPARWEQALWAAWLSLVLLWCLTVLVRSPSWHGRLVAVCFAVLSLAVVGAMVWPSSSRASAGIEWKAYSPELLMQARASKRPVLLEFTADWCINCKVLEHTVYADTSVARTLRKADGVALQINLTRPNEQLEKVLANYGGAALPFAVVLDRRNRVVAKFSGLFTSDALTDALSRTRRATGDSS